MTVYRPGDELIPGYDLITADPPWKYKGLQGPSLAHRIRAKADLMDFDGHMTTEEICAMPIKDLSDSAILILWTTNAFLANGDAARVCVAWGYQPRTVHTWVKVRPSGKPNLGTGVYGYNCTEHFIVARRGKPNIEAWHLAPAIPTVHFWVRPPRKAAKPPEAIALFERISPEQRRLELFARESRDGWDVWGNQVEGASE